MTAEEHIAAAARLMARASRHGSLRRRSLDVQAAQAHASLAQAITSAGTLALASGLAARLRVRGPVTLAGSLRPADGLPGCGFAWASDCAQPHECMLQRRHPGRHHCRCGAAG